MDGRFYVYALARPDGSYFYIGKGSRRRWADHELEARRGGDSLKCRIIRKIWAAGQAVGRVKLSEGITSQAACELERAWIAHIGRIDNGTGSLANHTDGGDGVIGHSAETIERLRAATRRQMTPEAKARLREIATAQFADEAVRQKMAETCREAQRRPHVRQANRERGLRQAADPKRREQLSAISKAYNSTDEAKRKNAEDRKAMWQDPEWRARVIAAQNAGRAKSALVNTPEIRAANSERMKKIWAERKRARDVTKQLVDGGLSPPVF